jgi:hypothetical protein
MPVSTTYKRRLSLSRFGKHVVIFNHGDLGLGISNCFFRTTLQTKSSPYSGANSLTPSWYVLKPGRFDENLDIGKKWFCEAQGGPGHAALKRTHAEFNKYWGGSRLREGAKTCSVIHCRGLMFGICNPSNDREMEASKFRNIAVKQDPGNGNKCNAHIPNPWSMQTFYIFSTDDWTFGLEMLIRRCV